MNLTSGAFITKVSLAQILLQVQRIKALQKLEPVVFITKAGLARTLL